MNIVLLLGILLILGLAATRISRLANFPNVTAFLVVGVLIGVICLLIDKSGYTSTTGNLISEDLSNMNSFISSVALGFIAMSIIYSIFYSFIRIIRFNIYRNKISYICRNQR